MFLKSFIGLVVIGVLGLIILMFVAKTQLPDMVANNLSGKLKTPVQIGSIDLSFKEIDVQKLEIENPQGYKLPIAFAADTIAVRAPLTNYIKTDVVIEEIEINNVYLGFEFESATSTDGNWTDIIKRAQEKAEGMPTLEGGKKKTVLIRRLILNHIQTDLLYRQQGGRVKHLPVINQIVLTDISSEGGSALDQIMNSALGSMLKQVFIQQNLKDVFNKFFDPNKTLKEALRPLKGLFNALPKETRYPSAEIKA